ncbi:MAG: putative Ig domain-containing protein [Oligoflexia bacterium]|nr:putative Ig domain-containing protein [Oligoflexia bacterium]
MKKNRIDRFFYLTLLTLFMLPYQNCVDSNKTLTSSLRLGSSTEPAPTSLSYSQNSAIYTKGIAITNNIPSNNGGKVSVYSITPALPSGLNFDIITGIISGTPTSTSILKTYIVTAANSSGYANAQINITINDPPLAPPSNLNYSLNPATYTQGVQITPNSPTVTGTVTSYSVVGTALPSGLTLNTSTGVISGTPTGISGATDYTIRASNSAGNTTKILTITVNTVLLQSPTNLNYLNNNAVYIKGTQITPNTPSISGGAAATYTINKNLPTGLLFESSTGVISGTPGAVSANTSYTIVASNSAGSTSKTITITVNDAAPKNLSYSENPAVYTKNSAITKNVLSFSGGTPTNYSISPLNLPSGLIFNTSNGEITGTPIVAALQANYTVTATNSTGSASVTLSLTVNNDVTPPPPPGSGSSFYVSPELTLGKDSYTCVQAQNASTPKLSIKSALSCLSAGKTLVLMNGTYSGNDNELTNLPSGNATDGYITIKAQNEGEVKFTAELDLEPPSIKSSYIIFQGLRFHSPNKKIYGTNLKFYRNEFKNGFSSGNNSNTAVISSSNILLEDNWFHGNGGRYNLLIFDSTNVVVRRAVIRHDGGWSDSCNPGCLPEAGITFYNSKDSAAQNVVVIDSDQNYNYWYGSFYNLQNSGISTPNQNNIFNGVIALNSIGTGFYTDHDPANTSIINSIFWDTYNGGITGTSGNISNVTIGRSKIVNSGDFRGGIGYWPGSSGGGPTVVNALVTNLNSKDFTGTTSLSYFNTYLNGSSSNGIGKVTYNPLTNGLKYITRIENNSPLKSAGISNGQIGAQIENQIGITGTYKDENGWNTTTSAPLWPFPNEERIKREMCTEANVTRGFCSDTTLTNYIMNYLGNGNSTSTPLAAECSGMQYFIAPNGSDNNNGLSEGTPLKTFKTAFSKLSSGDVLILLDGNYSPVNGNGTFSEPSSGLNTTQIPSGVNRSKMTCVVAKNSGNVKLVDYIKIGNKTLKYNFIRIEGLTVDGSIHLYNTDHVMIKNIGIKGNMSIGTIDHNNGNTNNLIEDVWVSSSGARILASNYRADKNIWRRVLIRGEGCGTSACSGSGNPNVGFTVYNSQDVSVQNVIVADRILAATDSPYGDFATAQHGLDSANNDPNEYLGNNEWLGTMSVNGADAGFHFEADSVVSNATTWTLKNILSLGTPTGIYIGKGLTSVTNATMYSPVSTVGEGIRYDPTQTSSTTTNVLIRGFNRGLSTPLKAQYTNVYGSTTLYNQAVPTVGAYNSDPLNDGNPKSLTYPVRIENSSFLKNKGLNGDIGANILFQYGADGTFYGEPNYNTLTTQSLWPYPNQTRIQKEMCTDVGVTRGFCGKQNISRYIWEYLGSTCPSSICG